MACYQLAVLNQLAAQLSACSERLEALRCVHPSCWKGNLLISNTQQRGACTVCTLVMMGYGIKVR